MKFAAFTLLFVVLAVSTAMADGIAEDVCKSNTDCSPVEYCVMEVGACLLSADSESAGVGVCKRTPEICTREYRPVCGCDLQTYPSKCTANSSRQNIAHLGACEKESK